jgi:MoaA/NifB/PqqE/SkfB family radical SAM enzyme
MLSPAIGFLTNYHMKRFLSCIDQGIDLGVRKIIVLGGGEPLCYPKIYAILDYKHIKKCEIELFTNGTTHYQRSSTNFYPLGVQTSNQNEQPPSRGAGHSRW